MVIVLAKIFLILFNNNSEILYFIEKILRVRGVPGTNMLALPIAFTLGSILNFCLLWIMFIKDFPLKKDLCVLKTFIESLIGALVMGIIAYVCLGIFDNVFDINTGLGIFLQGLISGVLGIITGLIVLVLLKNKQLLDLIKALKNKFWKKRVIAPEQSDL